jgi:hypothetical protein
MKLRMERRGYVTISACRHAKQRSLHETQIQPKDVEVTSIADKVANGEVWILSGSIA